MRNVCLLIHLIILMVFGRTIRAVEITCDRIEKTVFSTTCAFMETTGIDSDQVILKHSEKGVTDVIILGNKNFLYLPIMVYESFPNVSFYNAASCAIQKISKKNFLKLANLVTLYLSANQITSIEDNTFDDLEKLKTLGLSGNKIKQVTAKVFQHLKAINYVDLKSNECIDKNFYCPEEYQDLLTQVTKNCSHNQIESRTLLENSKFGLNTDCATYETVEDRIIEGTETSPEKWPFLATLHEDSTQSFFCGGVLITAKHVVTAAHCVHKKYDSQLNAEEVFVFIGWKNISRKAERGSQVRWVKEIFVHPDWDSSAEKYDADIAILELDEGVIYSNLIRPVCIDDYPLSQLSHDGKVVGWGTSGGPKNFQDLPHQADIRSVSGSVCFSSASLDKITNFINDFDRLFKQDYEIGPLFSPRMFCAKGNSTGPCKGDSGGGFFVQYEGKWILRGIVSASAKNFDDSCDITRHALYTQVSAFVTWINETISAE